MRDETRWGLHPCYESARWTDRRVASEDGSTAELAATTCGSGQPRISGDIEQLQSLVRLRRFGQRVGPEAFRRRCGAPEGVTPRCRGPPNDPQMIVIAHE